MATPRRLAGGAFLLVLAGAAWLGGSDPEHGRGLFPPCVWYVATHTHCPGCGITRALHDLLRGRVLAALDHNALGLVVLLTAAAVWARPAWKALRTDRWEPPRFPAHTARWLAIGGVTWAVLRNLPWAPFTVLAP